MNGAGRAAFLVVALLGGTAARDVGACWSAHAASPVEAAAYRFHVLIDEGRYEELDRESARARDLGRRLEDGTRLHAAWAAGLDADGEQCHRLRASMDPEAMARLQRHRERVHAWVVHSPGSAPARLAQALLPLQAVYALRGNDYAAHVKPEAWPRIARELTRAERALAALGEAGKADPLWYQAKLQIARMRAVDVTDYATILDEAMARFPDYEPLYLTASSYYTPNWGGSTQALADFVDLVVARTHERMGEEMYARLYWEHQQPAMFEGGDVDWKRMKAGFEEIVRRYPDAWNLNNFARFACVAGDTRTTHALFVRMGQPMAAAWPSRPGLEACEKMSGSSVPRTAMR